MKIIDWKHICIGTGWIFLPFSLYAFFAWTHYKHPCFCAKARTKGDTKALSWSIGQPCKNAILYIQYHTIQNYYVKKTYEKKRLCNFDSLFCTSQWSDRPGQQAKNEKREQPHGKRDQLCGIGLKFALNHDRKYHYQFSAWFIIVITRCMSRAIQKAVCSL